MKILLMKSFYITAVSFFFSISAWCQGSIKGTLIDTVSKQPVADATISILDAKDSSLVTFTRSNANGVFEARHLDRGNFRILITHVAYRNYSRLTSISENTSAVDMGYIPMTSRASLLDEVTILQEKAPVTLKNDTVEYNAGSFRTKPGAVVEDLLKKLPGVKVDKDGKIKAHGE